MYKPQFPIKLSIGHIYRQTYRQIHTDKPNLEMICKIYSDCKLVYWYRL